MTNGSKSLSSSSKSYPLATHLAAMIPPSSTNMSDVSSFLAQRLTEFHGLRRPLSRRWNRPESKAAPHRVQIALPVQFAPQSADLALLSELQQGSQAKLNGLALALQTGRAKRIPHELVVNHNIDSHQRG
jgi:hypothetical protein